VRRYFGLLVYNGGKLGDLQNRLVGKGQLDAFGFEQCNILLQQGVLRFLQDFYEIIHIQRAELDANRKPPLQLWNQVGRLADVKGARRDNKM